MPRDAKTLVQDMLENAAYLVGEVAKTDSDAYQKNITLQKAFLQTFTVMGEAAARLREEFPDVAKRIDEANKIAGFRNVIVHKYWDVDQEDVWSTASTNVAPLLEQLRLLLDDLQKS